MVQKIHLYTHGSWMGMGIEGVNFADASFEELPHSKDRP